MTILALWIVFLADGTALPGRLMLSRDCLKDARELRTLALMMIETNNRLPISQRAYLTEGNRPISHVECRPFRLEAGT